jgi:hypothetical protein
MKCSDDRHLCTQSTIPFSLLSLGYSCFYKCHNLEFDSINFSYFTCKKRIYMSLYIHFFSTSIIFKNSITFSINLEPEALSCAVEEQRNELSLGSLHILVQCIHVILP